jgi:hypothetical protein
MIKARRFGHENEENTTGSCPSFLADAERDKVLLKEALCGIG